MFAKERDWAVSYGSQIKDASEKFSAVANARLRLIQQLGHLAGALSITVAGKQSLYSSSSQSRSTKIRIKVVVHREGKVFLFINLHYSPGNEGANGVYNKLTSGFSGCIETIKVRINQPTNKSSL